MLHLMTIEEMKKNGTMDKYFQESFIKYVEEKNIGKEEIDLTLFILSSISLYMNTFIMFSLSFKIKSAHLPIITQESLSAISFIYCNNNIKRIWFRRKIYR